MRDETSRGDAGRAEDRRPHDGDGEEIPIKITDRRHWARSDAEREDETQEPESSPYPTMIDEFRARAEAAEQKLKDYIAAFKKFEQEQDAFRTRLQRDVDRRVGLRFGELVGELLETVDDLDLALEHVEDVADAEPLARGVAIARDRFLTVLEKHGVEAIRPDGEEFDPELSEAMQTEPVDSPGLDGKVTRTLRTGYRLGERVIRHARVVVGKLQN